MLYVTPPSQIGHSAFNSAAPAFPAREAEALKQYEQLFLFQLLKEMRKTVAIGDGVIGAGGEKAYFEEMLDDFLAGEMAASGQLGIARQMSLQMHAPPTVAAAVSEGSEIGVTPAGIGLNRPDTAIPILTEKLRGIEVPRASAGVPTTAAGAPGIPLQRAHRQYRMEN